MGYKKKLIDQLLFNKIKKSTLESIYSQKSEKEIDKAKIVLPYYGQILEKLKQKMKKLGFITIFKAPTTLGKELSLNKKDKLPDLEKEGVYSFKCGDCEAIYVGKTERNLKIRMSEHLRDFKNKKSENSLDDHLNSNNHSFPEGRN